MKLKRVKHELARLLVICLLFCNTMTVFAENTPSDAESDQTLPADEQVLAEDEDVLLEDEPGLTEDESGLSEDEPGFIEDEEASPEVINRIENTEKLELGKTYTVLPKDEEMTIKWTVETPGYYAVKISNRSGWVNIKTENEGIIYRETFVYNGYNAWHFYNITESDTYIVYFEFWDEDYDDCNFKVCPLPELQGLESFGVNRDIVMDYGMWGCNALSSNNPAALSGSNPTAPYIPNKEITPDDKEGNNKFNILIELELVLPEEEFPSPVYATKNHKLWNVYGIQQVISTVSGGNPVTDGKGYLPPGDYIVKFIAANGVSVNVPFKIKEPVNSNDSSVPGKVELNATELSLEVGKSSKLTATISPETATEKKGLTWSSSDETVASVDKDGNVTGNKVGSATITVKTENGKEAACKVTVTGGSFSYSVYLYADGNDAADYIIASMTYGNTDIIPYNQFDKPGYAFVGWNTSADGTGTSYENGQVVSNLTDTNNGIVKLYAQWKKIDNYIIYSLNGGFNNSANPDYYDGRETIKLSDPLRYGYDFNGWYSDATYKNKITEITKGSTGNVILYAKWTPHKYSIKFDANGGTGSMATLKNRSYDSCFELTANKFKRTGYNFIGWNTKADGSGSSYRNRETVSCLTTEDGKDVTLYAQWRQGGYTISYYLYGGYNNWYNPDFYEKGTYTLSFGNPYKSGYEFGGWFSKPGFKANDQVKTISADVGRNLNLYAKWIPNTYTVKFDPNESGIHSGSTGSGGKVSVTGSMSDMTNRVYGKKFTLRANKYKKEGYVFVGWNTRPDGSGTAYKNKAGVQNLTSVKGGTVTLYAQWEIVKFPITYKLNGGFINSVSGSNPSTYSSEDPEIILAKPLKAGYTFGGWYSKSNLNDAFKVDRIAPGSQGKKTFYAKWIANSYSVSFDGNGATGGEMEKMTKLYGKKFSLSANKFQREGYTFAGWNTRADGSGTAYKNKAGVKNLTSVANGNVKLYAQWNAK